MIVDIAVYTNGVRQPGPLGIEDCPGPTREPDSFVWLGLYEPTFAELDSVRESFGLHELIIEDAVQAHQRPKIEEYGSSLFVVLRTARYVDEIEAVEFGEIQLFLGQGFIISVRHSEASKLGHTRRALESEPELLAKGPSAVLYGIVDQVVDDYAPVIDGIDNDLREVEADVFSPGRRNSAERIFKLKREVLDFGRNTDPLTDSLNELHDGTHSQINPELNEYFRDIEDHLLRCQGRIDSISMLLSDALDANLAEVSVRQNDDMRKISAWAAIAVVPTMIAGIYGMNFKNMPELEQPWAYPFVLVLMAGVCTFMWSRFKKAGWL